MNYIEAKKAVESASKPKDSYMAITLNYDFTMLLPHKAGVALIESMVHAEEVNDSYSSLKRIVPLKRDRIAFKLMSHHEYTQHKMAALLNITVSDLERMEEEEMQKINIKETV